MKSMEKRRTNLSNSGNHSKWIDTIRLKTKKQKKKQYKCYNVPSKFASHSGMSQQFKNYHMYVIGLNK